MEQEEFLDRLVKDMKEKGVVRKKKNKNQDGYTVYNFPLAFDIETTSEVIDGEKYGYMYIWMFGTVDYCTHGRTFEEFISLLEELKTRLSISPDNRVIIYVHNLAFEFQFMRKYFSWEEVFAIDSRKPLYASTLDGFIFKCSYMLSGYSLDNIKLFKHKNIKKKVGDLDYSLKRNSKTPLTEKELGYCYSDIYKTSAFITEEIERNGDNILDIPYTKTGYVRRELQKRMKKTKEIYNIRKLVLTENIYELCKKAFAAGYTHSNPITTGEVLENISSFDFTSSYPAVMLLNSGYPMKKANAETVVETISEVRYYENDDRDWWRIAFENFCCIFQVTFRNLRPKFWCDFYLSSSRCLLEGNRELSNGRVVTCEELTTTITEIDFSIIERNYEWDSIEIDTSNFECWYRGRLPKTMLMYILELYEKKTELKDVEGREIEYAHSKESINSLFGLSAEDPVKMNHLYEGVDGEPWRDEEEPLFDSIESINKNSKRTIYFPWAIYICAFARRNLWSGIFECGDDYHYTDTDSLKISNLERHKDYFENYNKGILELIDETAKYLGVNKNRFSPKTIKGKEKTIGVWDYEGTFEKFKTLGAKRYMYMENGNYTLTVAGLPKKPHNYSGDKKFAIDYLTSYKDPFKKFENHLEVPKEYTSKLCLTYNDREEEIETVDYLGNKDRFKIKSGVYLGPASYKLGMDEEFVDFIEFLKSGKEIKRESIYMT